MRKRERERRADATRPSSPRRGYDRAWRALRADYLAANPTCKVPGCGAPAIEVHHLRDVRAHPHLRLEWSNLRGLCHTCHSRITVTTQGFARGNHTRGQRDGA
jgi:5-methylcytosine-specific restriction endonuclease McrA